MTVRLKADATGNLFDMRGQVGFSRTGTRHMAAVSGLSRT
jgi:hypothetical protein